MTQKLNIIHLEDVLSDAELIEWRLKQSELDFNLRWVNNREDFLRELEKEAPQVVICDHMLPDITSKEALQIVRSLPQKTAFILVTATVSEEFAVSMMKEGVDDYVLKDRLQRLPAAIKHAMIRQAAEIEQKRQFELIASQEKRFRKLFENAQEGIVLLDRNFQLMYRSASAMRITGRSDAELMEQGLFKVIHPEDSSWVRMVFDRSLVQPEKPFNNTFRLQHRQGHYIWLEMVITNMLEDPDVKALVLNFRDVTSRKEAAELQIQTTQYYRALIENISDAIIVIAADGTILYSSAAVKRTTGFDTDAESDLNIFDFFQEKDRPKAQQFLEMVKQHPDEILQNAFKLQRRDGTFVWVEGTIRNLLHNPSVNGCIINYRDVTERKIADEQLRKSEANLRTIFDNTNIAYTLLDQKFTVVSFNPLAYERYKETLHFLLREGDNILGYLDESHAADMQKKFNRVMQGENVYYEVSFDRHEGDKEWYRVGIFPVFDEKKSVLGLVMSSEDITTRKKSELENERMTADLLRHNKNLEQFAFIVSHNLRAPVANILGLTDLVQRRQELSEEELERCLTGLSASAHKLDDVIIDLNQILERKQLDGVIEEVDFGELTSDILAHLPKNYGGDRILIQTDFAIKKISSVKSYLHSIFHNLILNAIKYRNTKVRSELNISSRQENKGLTISFADNGLGINLEKYRDNIFGLYSKFHYNIEGRGMGLYMVKLQVELLGGRIAVRSEVNKGSTFEVWLPIRS